MKNPLRKYLFLLALLFVATPFVFAQKSETISDEEIRLWFEENEIKDRLEVDMQTLVVQVDTLQIEKSDSTNFQVENDSLQQNFVSSQTDSLVIETLDSLALITPEELQKIRLRAVERAKSNPLFMEEWVVSTAHDEELLDDDVFQIRKNAQAAIFRENPDVYAYHESQLPNIDEIIRRRVKAEKNQLKVEEGKTLKIDKLSKFKPTISPWSYGGSVQVQFSQNYYSDNWYTGGESSLAAYFFFKGKVGYKSEKIQWDTQLDAKFSFNMAASDSLRTIRTNDDLVKLTSNLGVRAFKSKNFYYSADFELSTPLFNTYVPNTYERVTGSFSPLRLYLSLGMEFKYKNELSVQVLPFSYKMLHVADTTKRAGVSESIADKQGIPAGQKTKNDLGSKVKLRWEHSFMREIKLETTFSLYTNYRGVELDWEIIGHFIINRFLSARVALNPRYDSTIVLPDGEDPKLQFKELVSVGFHYKF